MFFAINSIVVDPTDDPSVPHTGFDLDGLTSSDVDPRGCTHADYFSRLDPDQNCSAVDNRERCTEHSEICTCNHGDYRGCFGSVDNELPTLANLFNTTWGPGAYSNADLFRPQIHDDIQRTRNVLLVELLDVDNLTNDDAIRIRLFRGFAAPPTGCSAPFLTAVYQVDSRSLVAGGTTLDAAAWTSTGRIANGRISMDRPGASSVQTLWPVGYAMPSIEFTTADVQLAADIRGDTLERGNFGGSVAGEDVIGAVAMAAPDYVSVVRGLLGGVVDLQEHGVCDGSSMNPAQYGRVAIGFGFTAVRVEIDSAQPVVSAPSSGSCLFVPDAGAMDAGSDS